MKNPFTESLRDYSLIRRNASPKDILVTMLYQPSAKDLEKAYQLYRQNTAGFEGEMTQEDLNHYLRMVKQGY